MASSTLPKVLVTGASGYIAGHIVQQLLCAGYGVRGTVRSVQNLQKVAHLRQLCPEAEHSLELVEADLLDDKVWPDIVRGCKFVMHTASPVPIGIPESEDEVIKPAVQGTLSVLKACVGAAVEKVVLTSSVAAINSGLDNMTSSGTLSEKDWTDPTKTTQVYTKSKTLAEKAAWDFVDDLPADQKFDLAVMNPSVVLGPVFNHVKSSSMEIIIRLLDKPIPLLPHMNINVVDVRDVAHAHVVAMTSPEANGKRHLITAHAIWMKDMADILREEFEPTGYHPPKNHAPYFLMWGISFFNKRIGLLVNNWGIKTTYDNTRMTGVLGITPYPVRDSVIDMAHSMIAKGLIKKTSSYVGPKESE